MILCFGDSLTRGVPGTTYIKFLKDKRKYKNYGVGGDTVSGMTKRLKKKLNKSDCFIIGIGTNDVLLPYFENYSKTWSLAIKFKKIKHVFPAKDIKEFAKNYEEMLKLLKNKKVIVFGIPYFESVLEELNEQATEYNKVIEDLCNKYNIDYINIKEEQLKYKNLGEYEIPTNWLEVPHDVAITRRQKNIDKLSKKRGLKLTIDSIHFNTKSARMLAKLITKKIKSF